MFLLSVSIIDTWLGTHLYLTVDTKQSLGANSSSMLFSFKEKKKNATGLSMRLCLFVK
jgi:hypothetical protein